MIDPQWKPRLKAAVAKDQRSLRAISMAAGLGPNYLQQIFHKEKIPTIDNLIKICDELDISCVYILTGLHMTLEMEELLKTWQAADDDVRRALRTLARTHTS